MLKPRHISLAFLAGMAALAVPSYLVAQSNTARLSAIATESTVQIMGQNPGSGVLIAKRGETYCLLTAKHVVPSPDEYDIVTSSGDVYPLDFAQVRHIPEVDLAVVAFSSAQDYDVIELGDSDDISIGDPVFVSGWLQGRRIQGVLQFTSGTISSLPPRSLAGGYRLIYTNATHFGMSGGPVLSDDAKVVGIHGQVDGRQIFIPEVGAVSDDTPFRLGIPINTYTRAIADARDVCGAAPLAVPSEEVSPGETPPAVPPAGSRPVGRQPADGTPEDGSLSAAAPVRFTGGLRLVEVSNPSQDINAQANYYFEIDLANNAGQPLQQVTFKQVEGLEFPRFDVDDTQAFAGSRRSRGEALPLGLVVSDPPSRTVTVTFDPPLQPGLEFTVALNARNPGRDGTYIYQVVVYPEGDDSAEGRVIGTGRLRFDRPQRF